MKSTAVVKFNQIPQSLAEAMNWSSDIQNMKNAIKYHHGKTTEHYLVCGLLLLSIEKNKTWRSDGSCATSFFQFVENELHIKRSSAQRMMTVMKTFAPYLESFSDLILSVDFSKLCLISPALGKLETDDERIELIHSAENLSVRALQNNLTEMSGGIPTDTCSHEWTIKTVQKCKHCSLVLVKEG